MCKDQMKTRLFAIFLVFCMLAASMPMLAYAAEGNETDPTQQITEEEQTEAETQPSQETVEKVETTETGSDKAASESAGEAKTNQEPEKAESNDKPVPKALKAVAVVFENLYRTILMMKIRRCMFLRSKLLLLI